MTVNKITTPPSQKGVIDKINEVIDNLGGGGTATDVQINGTSITSSNVANIITESAYNASSNKIATMADIPSLSGYLQNSESGTDTLGILSNPNSNNYSNSVAIGVGSRLNAGSGVAVGYEATVSDTYATALGYRASARYSAIQLGYGANNTNSTFNVGFFRGTDNQSHNWQLLDGTTGLIPDARLSSNIARTSDIENATLTINQGGVPKGTFTANASSDVTINLENSSQRNIGEIVTSTIPLTDAGLHLLDGSLIQGGGIYDDFVTYIAGFISTYPDLFETEANWQTAVSTYGVCGKFVYDSVNNTVRLPKITGILEGTTDVTALGDLIEQYVKLPNITGSITFTQVEALTTNDGGTGSIYTSTGNVSKYSSSSSGTRYNQTLNVNASRSSSVYSGDGTNTKIQPQALKVLYYIVIATTTKTEIEVDIDEIATDLNGKADVDLTNCTKPHIVETYVNGTSWYRVYSDGWCEQGGTLTTGDLITFLKEFIDTNYTIVGSEVTSSSSATFRFANKATTSINFYTALPSCWQACGYIR